jgi:hypothetical protein
MPGVGTPFPEVGDFDYGTYGLAFAGYGEERINWGLLMIIDALRRAGKARRPLIRSGSVICCSRRYCAGWCCLSSRWWCGSYCRTALAN